MAWLQLHTPYQSKILNKSSIRQSTRFAVFLYPCDSSSFAPIASSAVATGSFGIPFLSMPSPCRIALVVRRRDGRLRWRLCGCPGRRGAGGLLDVTFVLLRTCRPGFSRTGDRTAEIAPAIIADDRTDVGHHQAGCGGAPARRPDSASHRGRGIPDSCHAAAAPVEIPGRGVLCRPSRASVLREPDRVHGLWAGDCGWFWRRPTPSRSGGR